jgi:tRNA A37 N6-isopentenylltransferase MiaA
MIHFNWLIDSFYFTLLQFYFMAEVFWNYDWYIDRIDVEADKFPDSINENQIKNKARSYVESRIKEWISKEDYDKLLEEIKKLLERQNAERIDLIQELRQREILETREKVDKEAMIAEAKTMIYEKLWINENQAQNSKIENFLK